MIKHRQSVLNFSKNQKSLNKEDYIRASSKKGIFSKPILKKYSFFRYKSTFINQLQKQKDKIEKEKTNKDISKINSKRTFKQNDFNLSMKNKSIKYQNNKSPKVRLKRNSFYKRKVNTKHFYLIRRQINQKLKNTYKSPYMDYLIEKGYYIHHKKSDYPKYYNYYMILNLMKNKRCKLTLRYYDHLFYYNNQEYLINYFGKNEYFIIINYLLFFIYDKDIESISTIKRKILSKKEIEIMFNDLLKNDYNFSGTLEILKDTVYYRYNDLTSLNLPKIIINLSNVIPVFNEKIKYLFAKDIPPLLFPNSYPNLFPLVGAILNYIKKFLKMRKFLKVTNNNINNNYNKSITFINEPKIGKNDKSYYDHNNSNNIKDKSKVNENNIFMNLSLSLSKSFDINNQSSDYNEYKNLHNSNRRLKIDNDIYDIETLVEKILFGYGYNLKNKNNQINLKNENILKSKSFFKKGIQRLKSMKNIKISYFHDKFSSSHLSKNEKLESDSKANLFKTSVKNSNKIKNKKTSILKKYNSNNLFILNEFLSLKKRNQKTIKDKIKFLSFKNNKEGNFSFHNSPLSILNLKKNIFNEKRLKNNNNIQKNRINFDEFKRSYNNGSSNNLDFIRLRVNKYAIKKNNFFLKSNYSNEKFLNSIIKEKSLNNKYFSRNKNSIKFKDTQEFMNNSAKNKYIVNRYISLKDTNKLSNKYQSIKKNKNYYKGPIQKAFNSRYGNNFDDKKINVWEDNKMDIITNNDIIRTNKLLNKVNNFDIQNQKYIRNNYSLFEIIKSPNIYI